MCGLADRSSFEEALVALGLITKPLRHYSLRIDDNWARGGAETYIYRFWLQEEGRPEQGYIMKACVSFQPGRDVQRVLLDWVERRHLLAENGVSTPILVAHGNGVLVEELVPYLLGHILSDVTVDHRTLLLELAKYIGVLCRLGFSPVDAYSDLRSRGNDVVPVDFGEDLGPPGASSWSPNTFYKAMIDKLVKWRVSVNNARLAEIQEMLFFTATAPD